MHIALTGATGFAGKLILQELLREKHTVKALARNPEALKNKNIEIVPGDLADATALAKLVNNAQCVVHVAGAIMAQNRSGYFKANLDGTKLLYAAAKSAGAARFIYISSITARESLLSDYAASKAAAELFLVGQKHGPEVLILRPSAIYGPGDKATLPLLKGLQSRYAILPGRASARFSLIHVQDFARVVASSITSPVCGILEVDDLSGGHTWAELVNIHRDLTGMPQTTLFAPKAAAHIVAGCVELFGLIARKPTMANRGKVTELYHQDWVARGANWPRDNPIVLKQGYEDTLKWYIEHGWLQNKFQIARRFT